jgi:hypothetical protein
VAQVKRAATFPGRGDGAGNGIDKLLQQGSRDDLRLIRGRADAGLPVRAFFGVVAFAGGGAV